MGERDSKSGYHHGNLRQALLDEARKLIREEGAGALTLRDLGQRLGVSRTAPYRHFKDRKALLSAVAEERARVFGATLREAREGEGNALARLRVMGRAYLGFARQDPSGYRLMFQEQQLLDDPDPALKEAMNAAFDELRELVLECQGAGVLKAGDPELTATYIWSISHGMASLLIDRRLPPEVDVEALGGFVERGLFDGVGRHSLDTLWQRLRDR
ncbi:TetR/AcrR family transcriptional regulator [Endothiovibrio diazotrophicus]